MRYIHWSVRTRWPEVNAYWLKVTWWGKLVQRQHRIREEKKEKDWGVGQKRGSTLLGVLHTLVFDDQLTMQRNKVYYNVIPKNILFIPSYMMNFYTRNKISVKILILLTNSSKVWLCICPSQSNLCGKTYEKIKKSWK